MAKLHEYQGKEILKKFEIKVPKSKLIKQTEDINQIEEWFTGDVVIKGQAWVTGRAGKGLIKFAHSRNEAMLEASQILGKDVGQHIIENVLLEEKLDIETL